MVFAPDSSRMVISMENPSNLSTFIPLYYKRVVRQFEFPVIFINIL